MTQRKIVVMGVSGSGKSLIGERLAAALGCAYHDADDFHSPANVAKMADGTPLSDADRAGWLDDLAALIAREPALVLACSALKRAYRDRLRDAAPSLDFVYLQGDFETIWARLDQRQGHYFSGADLLRDQFAQLEEPGSDEAHVVAVSRPPGAVVAECLARLGVAGGATHDRE